MQKACEQKCGDREDRNNRLLAEAHRALNEFASDLRGEVYGTFGVELTVESGMIQVVRRSVTQTTK